LKNDTDNNEDNNLNENHNKETFLTSDIEKKN
jgi:hypothetical protein